jgi:integral membrane protein
MNLLRKFESNRVFSQDEAWALFRLAAYGEAVGWTLLIIGIGLQKFVWPGSSLPVYFAGRTHGMLFFGYALAAIGLYPSLGWPRWKAVLAVAASVPPYGSLLFEWWASFRRTSADFENYRRCVALALLAG